MIHYTILSIFIKGVQWKQGVVIYMLLSTTLLYNTTPIRCTPLPLQPPVMNTQPSCILINDSNDNHTNEKTNKQNNDNNDNDNNNNDNDDNDNVDNNNKHDNDNSNNHISNNERFLGAGFLGAAPILLGTRSSQLAALVYLCLFLCLISLLRLSLQ